MSESTHFLILIDEDRRQFTVEGPLCDAQPWSRAVDKAREDGRKVKCCDIGSTSRAESDRTMATALRTLLPLGRTGTYRVASV